MKDFQMAANFQTVFVFLTFGKLFFVYIDAPASTLINEYGGVSRAAAVLVHAQAALTVGRGWRWGRLRNSG